MAFEMSSSNLLVLHELDHPVPPPVLLDAVGAGLGLHDRVREVELVRQLVQEGEDEAGALHDLAAAVLGQVRPGRVLEKGNFPCITSLLHMQRPSQSKVCLSFFAVFLSLILTFYLT